VAQASEPHLINSFYPTNMTNPFALSTIQFPLGDHGSLAVNAGGTRLAAAKPFGSALPVDLTDPTRDGTTLVPHGSGWVTITSALKMGILVRNGATVSETSPAEGARTW
jgi:hypothetical protein